MNLQLKKPQISNFKSEISITGSKSETNRLLLLQALYPNICIENASNSDDSEVMLKVLSESKILNLSSQIFDIHHAGTAMRFLTAYFAIQEGKEIILTGSSRMKERPIQILVEALNQLGAEISYPENEGFPPIKITGKKITNNIVSLPANVSSQYISALLLIAPKLQNGLELTLVGKITSIPYIKMTLALLNEIGVVTSFEKNVIKVNKFQTINSKLITVESDWSSASYWYSAIALSKVGTSVTLSSFKQNGLQGDSILVEIYDDFGVETIFNDNNSITIIKKESYSIEYAEYNLQNSPDIAQTIAVTCLGLGFECHLTGLHTLKIKETDRLEALKTELTKLGAEVLVTDESITILSSKGIKENVRISTYQDHRMAMAFAPLALKAPIIIENAEVVSKSYPNFWEDLENFGFQSEII